MNFFREGGRGEGREKRGERGERGARERERRERERERERERAGGHGQAHQARRGRRQGQAGRAHLCRLTRSDSDRLSSTRKSRPDPACGRARAVIRPGVFVAWPAGLPRARGTLTPGPRPPVPGPRPAGRWMRWMRGVKPTGVPRGRGRRPAGRDSAAATLVAEVQKTRKTLWV